MKIFSYYSDSNGGWFRLFGRGLSWTNKPPLFSERYGYVKKVKLFGFRFGLL